MKVLVGLSGGVDSSVAAYLLKKQGYDVAGVTMTIWGERPIPKNHNYSKDACFSPYEKEDVETARKIAQKLDIPYYVFDCSKDYDEIVLKNFKEEYLKGSTPNPCIRCNALVKFGVLPMLARKNGIEFDKFATGHYARIERIVSLNEGAADCSRYVLKRALDLSKDQTYFLYRLNGERLKNILFPLGELTKEDVRKIAKAAGLFTADKKDSQDFYSGSYSELLNLNKNIGNIVDKDGEILGKHQGIWNFTTGQRKGICVNSKKYAGKPLYVVELREDTNEVVVGEINETFKKALVADNLNWINGIPSEMKSGMEFSVQAKIRSTGKPVCAKIIFKENEVRVLFEEYQKSIAGGQSVVFYKDDIVLGGGIIKRAE